MTRDDKARPARHRPEDELLRLVQQEQSEEAVDELVLRYFPALGGLIAGQARHAGVQAADAEDIVQDAFPVLRAAVRRYAGTRFARCCRLRTFLGKVAVDHACDAVRHLGCLRRHDTQARRCAQEAAAGREATAALHWLDLPAAWKEEPALAAEGQEALAALAGAVAGFGHEDRLLWQGAWQGDPAAALADRLGVSCATIHRRLNRLVCRLRADVGSRH